MKENQENPQASVATTTGSVRLAAELEDAPLRG
jgi:hypothetical protein